MTINQAVATCLRDKYASFTGRAPRFEYWWFILAIVLYTLAVIVAFFAVNFITGGFAKASGLSSFGLLTLIGGAIGFAGLIVPGIAVTVRRFHDVNLSGWWVMAGILLGAVPLVGWIAIIAILVVATLNGTVGENRFGADPLI